MVALARRLDMAEFNAKNEAALLSTMAKGYDNLTHSTGGGQTAAKLYDEIGKEWCKLSPQQAATTADFFAAPGRLLKDGNGTTVGILVDYDPIFFDCSQKWLPNNHDLCF
jgi:hypothetical protein